MKTIIVPTDFSEDAWDAARYALEMAQAIEARLLLMHVFPVPLVYAELPVSINTDEQMNEVEKNIRILQDQLYAQARPGAGISTDVRMGDFYTELAGICEELQPEMVIMGCQGTTASEQFLFGSHAVHAMQHLKWPLITVPRGMVFSGIQTIALACDLHDVMHTVPSTALTAILDMFQAKLLIFNIGKDEVFDPEVVFESGVLGGLLRDKQPLSHFVGSANTDEAILDLVKVKQVDLLIVLPKRHSLVERILHKSHTRDFVLHSPIPVLSLHK